MQQIYDRLPYGSMDNFHKYREKHYDYTYLCRSCGRSFDSKNELTACKFCQGNIVEIRRIKRVKSGPLNRTKMKYQYVCSICDANFESEEPINNCHFCRTKWLHVYEWGQLSKTDKFTIKFMGAMKNLIRKHERPKTKIHRVFKNSAESMENENNMVHNECQVKSNPKEKLTVRVRKPVLKRRPKEEMPTY